MKNTKENEKAIATYFVNLCRWYGLPCQLPEDGFDNTKVNLEAGTMEQDKHGWCRVREGLDHCALIRLNREYILQEDVSVSQVRAVVTHEVTHAWEHEFDPEFYFRAVNFFNKYDFLYSTRGNLIEECARMAERGIDIRPIYKVILKRDFVRRGIEEGDINVVWKIDSMIGKYENMVFHDQRLRMPECFIERIK